MKISEEGRSRLIYALDTGRDIDEALRWVDLLKTHVGMFKVGKEAFTAFGPEIVRKILERGGEVFLDLKFHDIPNTVAQAGREAVRLGVNMFNVHALGGKTMMKGVVQSAGETAGEARRGMPVILAVTVLTSLNALDLKELGFALPSPESLAVSLACLAKDAGVHGVVASPREIGPIRKACGDAFIIVTPGIRMESMIGGDDQKRTMGPREAIMEGADYIVVGRPIRQADNPVQAARDICTLIDEGLQSRALNGNAGPGC